jgi:hypothetical protein
LNGVRQRPGGRLAVTAAAIAGHDLDSGMIGKPRLNRRDLAIGQQRHDPSPLEIADNRSVVAIASKSPIVDADDGQRIGSRRRPPSYNPKQRIVADRQHQPFGEARRWSAAECQPQMVDDAFQARRPARSVGRTLSPNRSAKIRRRQ